MFIKGLTLVWVVVLGIELKSCSGLASFSSVSYIYHSQGSALSQKCPEHSSGHILVGFKPRLAHSGLSLQRAEEEDRTPLVFPYEAF